MKFIVEKSVLVAAMTRIAGIADKRQIIPILGHVLIESEAAGVVRLRSSNLDMEACEVVPCDMLNELGAATVSAHSLLDIARNAPDGSTLKFELGDRLVVKYGRSRFQLSCLPAADFPALMTTDIPGSFTVAADTLRDALSRTSYAMATDNSLAHLSGVRLEFRDGEIWAAATNFKVLAMAKFPAPGGSQDVGVTIPARMVDTVTRLLGGVSGDVDVAYSSQKISVTIGAVVVTSKVLDGSFVNFPIAVDQPVKIRAARDELIATIIRVRATTDKADGIRLTFADGSIQAQTRNTEGEGVDEITAEYDGDEFAIGFGAKFILDVLENLKGDIVEFQFREGATGPVIVGAPSDPDTMVNMGTQRV